MSHMTPLRLRSAVYVALLCSSPAGLGQEKRDSKPPQAAYCKVAVHPSKYDHRVLRVKGIYRSGGEIMAFYDPTCPQKSSTAWVDYAEGLRQKSSPELIAAMEKLLSADGRAQVEVLAEFDGPKPVSIPSGTSPGLAAVMRGTNSRYGHANQFRYRLLFLQLLGVSPVVKTVPWPQ